MVAPVIKDDRVNKQLLGGFLLGIFASFIANVVFHLINSSQQAVAMQTHPHGEHICYCPECGYQMIADAYLKCRELSCPQCGNRMRASNVGEFHPI